MFPLVISNYISPGDCKVLIDLLDPLAQPSPREGIAVALGYKNSKEASQAGATIPLIQNFSPRGDEDIAASKILGRVFSDVKASFEDVFKSEAALTQGLYQNMTIGGHNPLHSDTTDLQGNPLQLDGEPEEMEWSGLLYLNNWGEDFEGGTLLFPKQNLEIFPKAGDMVIFPGDFEHVHEVPAVTSGARKNLVFFYGRPENIGSDRNFYEIHNVPPSDHASDYVGD